MVLFTLFFIDKYSTHHNFIIRESENGAKTKVQVYDWKDDVVIYKLEDTVHLTKHEQYPLHVICLFASSCSPNNPRVRHSLSYNRKQLLAHE